jgi:hypothetical protein
LPTTGVEIGLVPSAVEGLQNASAGDPRQVEVEAAGLGIRFPALDADLYPPALLEGAPASKRWMAAQLGAAGGRTRSDAKAAPARANGQRGGRPRKAAATGG